MKIDLSIIIVSYNTKKLTLQCIESIVKNTKKLKYEIIVVDNASSDGSLELLEKFQNSPEKLRHGAGKIPKFQVVSNQSNLGFSRANNQGIKKAKGKYVLLLNSDTEVKKGSLKRLLDFVKKTKNAGVVGTRLLNAGGSTQPSCYNFPTIGKAVRQYWLGEKGLVDKYSPKAKKPAKVDAVVGAAFLITPTARKKVGLLNEKYFMYFEDIDYCRSVWKAGLKVYYLPSAEIIHYHGESGRGIADIQKRRLIESSKNYHGAFKHYLTNFIIWSGQKWQKLRKILN